MLCYDLWCVYDKQHLGLGRTINRLYVIVSIHAASIIKWKHDHPWF